MSEAYAIYPQAHIYPVPNKPSAQDLFAAYMDYTSVKDSTMKGYLTCIKAFASWLSDNGIMQPTRLDIKAYEKYLTGSTYKPGTQGQYLRAVKSFFKWTAAEGLYPNIADNIKGAKVRHDQHKKDALGREDVPAIAEKIDRSTEQGKRLYALYLICIADGLRTIEISRANLEDIKTMGGRTYLYVQGKGHDEKDAPVLLPQEVKEALDVYIASRTDKPTGKSPLFVSTSNRSKGKRIAPTTISTMLKSLMVSAGYDSDRLTAHSLRHTSGTGAYKATHNLYLTQQHQRHCDPATTEIYMHCEEREERNTEELVYNYYFKADAEADPCKEALDILQRMPADKQKQALELLKAFAG